MKGSLNRRCAMVFLLMWHLSVESNAISQESESEREADLFGAEDAAVDHSKSKEERIFGKPQNSQSKESRSLDSSGLLTGEDINQKLDQVDDPLAIGGKMYMRFQYDVVDQGSLEEFRLSSPNLLNLYLDGRPNDRVRAFVRGRMLFDFTVEAGELDMFGQAREPLELFLDQFWLKFDIGRAVYVTLGRQMVRWGSGHFWNPTDFLNQQRRDPLAIFDERLGTSLLKIHVPVESLGWNFYAVANLDSASSPKQVGGALRAEMLLGPAELAMSAALRKDQPVRLGLDISAGVYDIDLRLEGAVLRGEKNPFFSGRFDPATLTLPESYSREDDWIFQVSCGVEYSFLYSDQDSILMGLEYFYNDAGYTDANLYPYLAMQGQFVPFYLGQQYISAYVLLMQPGDWNDTTFILSGIANLSDGTGVVRFDYRVLLLTYLELDAFINVHTGERGEFHYGLEVPPLAGIPGLENGLSIPGQVLELGLWLVLKI